MNIIKLKEFVDKFNTEPESQWESIFNEMIITFIFDTPQKAYCGARDYYKRPIPEAEELIATDGQYSYYYACEILKKPFPLGEVAIANSDYKKRYMNKFHVNLAESVLRSKYPSLQDSWNQYQMVLELIKSGNAPEEDKE